MECRSGPVARALASVRPYRIKYLVKRHVWLKFMQRISWTGEKGEQKRDLIADRASRDQETAFRAQGNIPKNLSSGVTSAALRLFPFSFPRVCKHVRSYSSWPDRDHNHSCVLISYQQRLLVQAFQSLLGLTPDYTVAIRSRKHLQWSRLEHCRRLCISSHPKGF